MLSRTRHFLKWQQPRNGQLDGRVGALRDKRLAHFLTMLPTITPIA
jgi:hypothetical protein